MKKSLRTMRGAGRARGGLCVSAKPFHKRLAENWQMYLLLLIPIAYLIVFCYWPMVGAQIAFRNYKIRLGIWNSSWVGLEQFQRFFQSYYFGRVVGNTLRLSFYSILIGFPLPVVFALQMNAMLAARARKFAQTVTYMPHFISVVTLAGVIMQVLNVRFGIFAQVYRMLYGAEAAVPNLLLSASAFPHIYVLSGVWQNLGWDTVIYTAALTGVDPTLHEVATIDGASRFKRILHVDFPAILPTITGASGIGIGREIAEQFYRAGAKTAICSRSEERIRQAAVEIAGDSGERLLFMAADVSRREDAWRFVDAVVKHFGRIDVLVNNAGVQFPKPSLEVTEEDWQRTVDTNLKGYFFAAQQAAKYMISMGGGAIVNIGSVNAVTVMPGQAVYAATKAGVSQITKSLAREWSRQGIRVNCVGPGSIPTLINREIYREPAAERAMCEKIPMGRRGTAREVADAVMYLASERASYITGQTLFVDGGLTLVHG